MWRGSFKTLRLEQDRIYGLLLAVVVDLNARQ